MLSPTYDTDHDQHLSHIYVNLIKWQQISFASVESTPNSGLESYVYDNIWRAI